LHKFAQVRKESIFREKLSKEAPAQRNSKR